MTDDINKWCIASELKNLDYNIEFIFELQKSILLALVEHKQINLNQYTYITELLEKKKYRK